MDIRWDIRREGRAWSADVAVKLGDPRVWAEAVADRPRG